MICPHCAGPMSTPLFGRRTKLWLSTCRDCGRTTQVQEPPAWSQAQPTSSESAHAQMFVPSTARPEPPAPKGGAIEKFNAARAAGTVRQAIQQQRRLAFTTQAQDGKLKAIGGTE